MKMSEILREDQENSKPHLYLDMDGVQADFFGAWSDYHNVPHWKAIGDREKEIEQLASSSAKEVYDYFRNLEPLPGGKKVVEWLKRHNIPFTVLSAPLRGPYKEASIKAKQDWLDEFNPGTSSSAIFTGNKFKYAMSDGKPNVLVDDFGPYLKAWHDAGGIAVKHEDEHEISNSGEETIKTLEKIYLSDDLIKENNQMKHRVFVYGTLKQGNNIRGLDTFGNAEMTGTAFTSEPAYSLYDLGSFPAATLDGKNKISGEVWQVDDQTMDILDSIEGYPDFYNRKKVSTTEGTAWMYYIPDISKYSGVEQITAEPRQTVSWN